MQGEILELGFEVRSEYFVILPNFGHLLTRKVVNHKLIYKGQYTLMRTSNTLTHSEIASTADLTGPNKSPHPFKTSPRVFSPVHAICAGSYLGGPETISAGTERASMVEGDGTARTASEGASIVGPELTTVDCKPHVGAGPVSTGEITGAEPEPEATFEAVAVAPGCYYETGDSSDHRHC
jgi:hypothetical protein